LCNSCASLAGLVLCFIACFILLVIAPLCCVACLPSGHASRLISSPSQSVTMYSARAVTLVVSDTLIVRVTYLRTICRQLLKVARVSRHQLSRPLRSWWKKQNKISSTSSIKSVDALLASLTLPRSEHRYRRRTKSFKLF